MASPDRREYSASLGWKFCCWFATMGAVLVLVTYAVILPRWIELTRKEVAGNTLAVGILAVAPFVLLLVHRWRLRVDPEGVWRRRLFKWDLWSRADLASGRIRKLGLQSRTLYDPNRPFWSRYLRLDLLSDSDFGEVLTEINKTYRLPPLTPVPERLELHYGFLKLATFENTGVLLKRGRAVRDFKWSDVEDIHIHRWEPVSRSFCTVLVTLPEDEVELSPLNNHGGQRPPWQGFTAEEISEFFMACPARDRVHVSSELEGWNRLRDVDRALTMGRVRWLSIAVAAIATAWVGFVVSAAIDEGLVVPVCATLLLSILMGPLVLLAFREWRQRRDKLETRRAALMKEQLAPGA